MENVSNQTRIDAAENFFNLLYGNVTERKFGYLWAKQGDLKKTFPFDVSTPDNRRQMAVKAIELNDNGFDVYYGINLVDMPLTSGERAKHEIVTMQTATVTDIDIEGGTHTSTDKKFYPPDFDTAKYFLPFVTSILINSGYGLHGLNLYSTPITITDDNRDEAKARNEKFISLIRGRAGKYADAVDGVGDLPRILRVPGTHNYKCGRENAPLCHVVEVNDVRFTAADMDSRLNALIPDKQPDTKPARTTQKAQQRDFVDDSNFNIFRARRMLDFIPPSTLTYDDWFAVGAALKNIGCDCSDWEQWSRADDRFKDGECESKWNGFNRDGYDIGTLYHFAEPNGYDAKETCREWYQLHPESKLSDRADCHTLIDLSETPSAITNDKATQIDSLKIKLLETNKSLDDFTAEIGKALEILRNVEKFDSATAFSDDVVTGGAFAYLFDREVYSNFKRELKLYGDKHKEEKAAVNDWIASVRTKAAMINSRRSELITRRNEIQAQITSLSFIARNDELADIEIPHEYGISSKYGVEKVAGEKSILVCRRPVIITAKIFNVEEKIYKLILSFMTTNGKWKTLPVTEKAILANKNKIVELANNDLPITTSNATLLVDYLDAFNALNENNLPLNYNVNRCGWYHFNDRDYFIDPRRECIIQDEDKNISVKVDETRSEFAKHLRQVGSLENWKKAYLLAKKSSVARLIVDAAIAPILLKVLGERNFLLYIYAPTRAGKTTALMLSASAVGSEKIIRSFDATKNGLAGAAADVNDYPFFVDEKQVADNNLKDTFANLVYALANGIGRTKLNKDSTLKKVHDWRTIAIMTGETQMLSDNVTGGANTRLLTIKTPKEILSATDCKIIRDTIKDNNGLVFPLVIDKVLEVGRDNLRRIFEEMVAAFEELSPETLPEYRRYMAVLTLADALLNSSVFGNTTITPDGETIKASDDAMINAGKIFPLIPTTDEISDTPREKEFVRGFIVQNQNRFIGGNAPLDRMQAIYGKLDDKEYIYIVAKALQEVCAIDGFNYHKLVDDLVAIGFFTPADTIEKGRKTPLATVKKRLGKVNSRCYRIKHSVFDDD